MLPTLYRIRSESITKSSKQPHKHRDWTHKLQSVAVRLIKTAMTSPSHIMSFLYNKLFYQYCSQILPLQGFSQRQPSSILPLTCMLRSSNAKLLSLGMSATLSYHTNCLVIAIQHTRVTRTTPTPGDVGIRWSHFCWCHHDTKTAQGSNRCKYDTQVFQSIQCCCTCRCSESIFLAHLKSRGEYQKFSLHT